MCLIVSAGSFTQNHAAAAVFPVPAILRKPKKTQAARPVSMQADYSKCIGIPEEGKLRKLLFSGIHIGTFLCTFRSIFSGSMAFFGNFCYPYFIMNR